MIATDAPALDELIPLRELAARLPRRRKNKKTHVATLYRWTDHGCRGRKLRYIQCGATRCSTLAWVHEFFDALAAPTRDEAAVSPDALIAPLSGRTPAARRKAMEKADRDIAQMKR
jgi:hypothetical protein